MWKTLLFFVALSSLYDFVPQCLSLRTTKISCLDKSGQEEEMTCTGEHVVYHCIPNEHNQEVEVCVQWKWISPGYCPYYDSPSKAVKELHCAHYCLQNIKLQETCVCSSRLSVNTSCSEECKQDFSSNTYIFCGYENPSTVVNPSSATSSSTDDYFTHKEERNGTVDSNVNNDNRTMISVAISCGVLLPLLTVILVILRYKHLKCLEGYEKDNTEVENGENQYQTSANRRNNERLTSTRTNVPETEPLFSNENQNNAGNQQDPTRNNMDEGEEVKLSEWPISEDNTGNNESDKTKVATDKASSEDMVSAESDRKGFMSDILPDKEEESINEKEGSTGEKRGGSSGEKDGSTPEKDESEELRGEKEGSTGEVDVSEESTDEKEGSTGDKEGSTFTGDKYKTESAGENIRDPVQSLVEDEPTDVFDDTAESLQKELVNPKDIEFCQELYEFLNEVCTRPERKLFKSLLSKNVEKSPAEVLKDASIQTELKEELPPEYHASISSEAEDNESVIILYYLLRKFLKEKDAPKSGWSKPVKNTDTGIGDDVERLYRVYFIIREISDPGKIPVENYQRLLNVVFDAFTRLDIDDKFKDDRNKLFKKLQDIKNHLWFQESLSNYFVI